MIVIETPNSACKLIESEERYLKGTNQMKLDKTLTKKKHGGPMFGYRQGYAHVVVNETQPIMTETIIIHFCIIVIFIIIIIIIICRKGWWW